LLELCYLDSEHRLRKIVCSASVQDLHVNRAAHPTFRTQTEQIQTYLEQPQIRLETK
jgi:hypothetical protein